MTIFNNELPGAEKSTRPQGGHDSYVRHDAPTQLHIHGTAASDRSRNPMVVPPLAFAAKHAAAECN
ncbi:hypothetical protein ACIA8C_37470 [Nocardia sp. NPDC051321]|uniref:hypothetical protein n=1 Tax=Nocardia sp. NPDC051321 TaxID=3364323 RepID=UPI0037A11CAA